MLTCKPVKGLEFLKNLSQVFQHILGIALTEAHFIGILDVHDARADGLVQCQGEISAPSQEEGKDGGSCRRNPPQRGPN